MLALMNSSNSALAKSDAYSMIIAWTKYLSAEVTMAIVDSEETD
jgi:hypothetical protein